MFKKRIRQLVFVCSAVKENSLFNKIIAANTQDEAFNLFFEEYKIKPQEVLGPFYKKKVQVLENTRVLKFSNQSRKAHYDNWLVNAVILQEPKDSAYLIFIKRLDDKKVPTPKGTIVVKISDLRFLC